MISHIKPVANTVATVLCVFSTRIEHLLHFLASLCTTLYRLPERFELARISRVLCLLTDRAEYCDKGPKVGLNVADIFGLAFEA